MELFDDFATHNDGKVQALEKPGEAALFFPRVAVSARAEDAAATIISAYGDCVQLTRWSWGGTIVIVGETLLVPI